MSPDDFAVKAAVSRETQARLETYAALLIKWQKAVNLVGPKTLPDLWSRHMLDSAQLWPFIPQEARILIDFGSGAGFPGLVLAILASERKPELKVHLVEADQKKATFLREVARLTETDVAIHASRIEHLAPFPADVVTARALAPTADLAAWSEPFWHRDTLGLFLKGQNLENELTPLREFGRIEFCQHLSLSDPEGRILEMRRR